VIRRAAGAAWSAAITMVWVLAASAGDAPAPVSATAPAGLSPASAGIELAVPIVVQRPERCGPAALAMVLRFHGATAEQVALADSAYDPALRGALITDLAASARRAGFDARVEQLNEDSLVTLLHQKHPPILLYRRGIGPMSPQHYGVLVGWDRNRGRWILHDGGRTPHLMSRRDLAARWTAAGSEALVVRPIAP